MSQSTDRRSVQLTSTDVVMPAVTDFFRMIFNVWDVEPGDSFLDLGGASLAAAQLDVAVRERFGITLGVTFIFDHPTVAEITAEIERRLAV